MANDPSPLSGVDRDAFEAMSYFFRKQAQFSDVDAAELEAFVQKALVEDWSQDTIDRAILETKAYKQRFGVANDARLARGLSVLKPSEIVGMEGQYKDLFRQYGLPQGMFDSPDDFVKYLGADVSPSEMTHRLDIAKDAILSDDPGVRSMYQNWYAQGLTEGDAIAALLDPDKGLPAAESKARSAKLGAYSQQQGLGMNQARAEELAGLGVNADRGAFGQVADIQRNAGTLSSRYGLEYGGQKDAEDAVLLGDSDSRDRIKKLGEAEKASFGGKAAGGSGSLGRARY